MVMIVVNIHELKARVSELVEQATHGERVVICNRNRPVAELVAVQPKRLEPRPAGPGPFTYSVPEAFFEEMPDDFIGAIEGGAVFEKPDDRGVSRVAEQAPPYGE